jgi:hypothetical protein
MTNIWNFLLWFISKGLPPGLIGWGNERLPYEGLLQKLPRFSHLYSLFPFSGKNTSRLAINYHFSGKYAFPGPIFLCREPNNPSFATEQSLLPGLQCK